MATDAGLADLSSENLLAELTAPLEVCYGTLDAARSLGKRSRVSRHSTSFQVLKL